VRWFFSTGTHTRGGWQYSRGRECCHLVCFHLFLVFLEFSSLKLVLWLVIELLHFIMCSKPLESTTIIFPNSSVVLPFPDLHDFKLNYIKNLIISWIKTLQNVSQTVCNFSKKSSKLKQNLTKINEKYIENNVRWYAFKIAQRTRFHSRTLRPMSCGCWT